MATDIETPRSRRAVLTAALGAGAATVAAAIARPLPASAADNEAVLVGGEYLGSSVTKIDVGANDAVAIWGLSTPNIGVFGTSGSSTGVFGSSNSDVGTHGFSSATDRPGAAGESYGGSTGVQGVSGQSGLPAAPAKTGVHGYAAQDATAAGVKGESTAGTGVLAVATTGNALDVQGKAKFSRSGKASVAANAKYVDVTVPGGLGSHSVAHAAIQIYRSGVSIAAIRPNWPTAGKIRIYLTKVASTTSSTPVGWFVAEY